MPGWPLNGFHAKPRVTQLLIDDDSPQSLETQIRRFRVLVLHPPTGRTYRSETHRANGVHFVELSR